MATNAIMVGKSTSNLSPLPVEPTAITYGLQDISAADAGRTQDANVTMHKNRIAQKRKLSLSWTNPTLAEASAIMKAFNPEYIYIRYIDVMEGGYVIKQFYRGDISSAFREIRDKTANSVMSTLSFDVIEV